MNSFYSLLQPISMFHYFLIYHAKLGWKAAEKVGGKDQHTSGNYRSEPVCSQRAPISQDTSKQAFQLHLLVLIMSTSLENNYLCFCKKCFQSCQIFSYHPVLGGEGEEERTLIYQPQTLTYIKQQQESSFPPSRRRATRKHEFDLQYAILNGILLHNIEQTLRWKRWILPWSNKQSTRFAVNINIG